MSKTIEYPNIKNLKFDAADHATFAGELRKRVNQYFADNQISKFGTGALHIKTIIAFSLYLIPYFLMISGVITHVWLMYGLWTVMGIATATIGTCIMHDSIHGSYSKTPWINTVLGQSMNLIGGNAYVWKMQHNVLHHTFTNVNHVDDDIDIPVLMKMSPHQKQYSFHRFQHIYVWFLYSLATLFWVTTKDFVQLNKYKQRGMMKDNKEYLIRLFNIIFWKIIYYAYLLAIPLIFIPASNLQIIGMFVTMHLVAGILLSIIFQPAHVFPDTTFTDEKVTQFPHNYVVHQFLTTTNFTLRDPFFSNIAGGLNYQIEHHLFPTVSHVHYKAISPIVKQTAEEFGIPYYCENNLTDALISHGNMLKKMGNMESKSLEFA